MTAQSTTTPRPPARLRRRALPSVPGVAGIAFVAAWTAGLAVWPTNLALDASDATVFTAYTRHQGAAVTQYLFVEGVAAAALAVVVVAFGQAAGRRGASGLGRLSVLAGVGAAIVSLIECVLGLLLDRAADPDGDANRAGDLFDLINRLDGVKMLALATNGTRRRWSGAPRSSASGLAGPHRRTARLGHDRFQRRLPTAEQHRRPGSSPVVTAIADLGRRDRPSPRPPWSIDQHCAPDASTRTPPADVKCEWHQPESARACR